MAQLALRDRRRRGALRAAYPARAASCSSNPINAYRPARVTAATSSCTAALDRLVPVSLARAAARRRRTGRSKIVERCATCR